MNRTVAHNKTYLGPNTDNKMFLDFWASKAEPTWTRWLCCRNKDHN